MISFKYEIGEKKRVGSRFISHVRKEIQNAYLAEKKERKLTQQAVAEKLGVNRSSVNRQLMGEENITLRSAAELLWGIGWEPNFSATRADSSATSNMRPSSLAQSDVTSGDTPRARATYDVPDTGHIISGTNAGPSTSQSKKYLNSRGMEAAE